MTNEKKIEVLEEALNYYHDRTSLTNKEEKELQNFFDELKETILVTRCCCKLKDKENVSFDDLKQLEYKNNVLNDILNKQSDNIKLIN